MALGFCIPKFGMDKIREALSNGRVTVQELSDMSSIERRNFFEEIVGADVAKELNANFESRLLLKNQKLALERWVESFDKLKEPVKRDLLSKIQKLTEPLSETDRDKFLNDFLESKLEFTPTIEEANQLAKLANEAKIKRESIVSYGTKENPSDEALAYGKAKADFEEYANDLINPSNKEGIGSTLKNYFKDAKSNPIGTVSKFGGLTKSLKAGLDNSALFRQGLKTLITNPREWITNARQSFKTIWDTFGGKNVLKEIKARMYADPDYDLAVRSKLAVGADDYIPTTIHEKIPFAGKAFAASDNAFSGFLYKTRFDVFKKYIELARNAGLDTTDKELTEGIAKMVNSQTGRGSLGRAEAVGNIFNNIFFSPRFVVSQLDTFLHPITGAGGGNFVRKEAAKSLAKIVGTIGSVMAISNALQPGTAETDPRSTDFGKIRFGDHRADITGGLGSMITLISRLSTQKSKSATTGKITQLNERDKKGNLTYGARTGTDVATDYLQNKLSPLASLINDIYIRHSTYAGGKPTVGNELSNLFAPLPTVTAFNNIQDPDAASAIADSILDSLGFSTINYNKFKTKK